MQKYPRIREKKRGNLKHREDPPVMSWAVLCVTARRFNPAGIWSSIIHHKGHLSPFKRSFLQGARPTNKQKTSNNQLAIIKIISSHTSSPSLRSRGADTYAKLSVRSWLRLVTCDRSRVSPDRTALTRASRGISFQAYLVWCCREVRRRGEGKGGEEWKRKKGDECDDLRVDN